MATGGSTIAKAGWLHRQSSVLKRWKRNWFVLQRDGNLLFFDSPNCHRAEERIVVHVQVKHIKPESAPSLAHVAPPEGALRSCLFALAMKEGPDLVLCAESTDDSKAWQIALEEARVMMPGAPPPTMVPQAPMMMSPYTTVYTSYGGYPGQVLSTSAPATTYYVNAPGTTTTVYQPPAQVVYVDDDYYGPYRRRYGGYYGGGFYLGGPMWW